MSENNLKALKKLKGIGSGTVSQITSMPNKPQVEKMSKTIRIKSATHEMMVELYGKKVDSQGGVVDKGVAILYALWNILPEEQFFRIIQLAEEGRFDELSDRLGIKKNE